MARNQITSYKQFKEYCLRRLGDPVICVNLDDKQIEDRICDALATWNDFHFEGAEEFSLLKDITLEDINNGYVEVTELNAIYEVLWRKGQGVYENVERMDDLDYRFYAEYNDTLRSSTSNILQNPLTDYYITFEYLASMEHLFNATQLITFNNTTKRLYLTGQIDASMNSTNIVEEFRDGNWTQTNCALTIDDITMPSGKDLGSTITDTSSGTLTNKISFTKTVDYYPRGLYTATVLMKQGTYTGKVILRIKDREDNVVAQKTVQPGTFWKRQYVEATYKEPYVNDYIFKIETESIPGAGETLEVSVPTMWRNGFLVLRGYKKVTEDNSEILWNSGWLKDYATAQLKKQWGQNLKKFDGVTMPGGVTLNGQQIYDDAVDEITALKEDLELKWGFPPGIFIG
jgi:hypothetical protein